MRVRVSDHARFDSFPLRYGFSPDEFLETSSESEDETGTSNQKPREIRDGNKHIICRLWTLSGEDLGKARIVLRPQRRSELYSTIVTALSLQHIPADRAVSEIIQLKRRRGEITTDLIRSTLHPLYIKKMLTSPESLIDIFIEIGIAEHGKREEELERLLAEASEESEALARRNTELEKQNRELEDRIFQREKRKPGYRNEDLKVSPIATLSLVESRSRTNSRGMVVRCTVLHFKEPDLPKRTMDEVFDPGGAIARKAKSLEGKQVRTVTWRPDIFKPLEWFRDIYAIDGQQAT